MYLPRILDDVPSRAGKSALLLALAVLCTTATAADGDLAKASQNPISSLISVPFENNSNFDVGPQDSYQNVLNIKPVVPVQLTENWSLVNRAIIPIIYLDKRFPGSSPNFNAFGNTHTRLLPAAGSRDASESESQFGGGDILYQGFLTPAKPGKLIWGIGPSIGLPTGANEFSSNKWLVGPNAVVLAMPGHWVIGALVSNVWSFAGDDDEPDVNEFTAQYFINYNLEKGWYVKTTPVITADWKASSSERWTVPIGGGFGRVFKIGKQPVNMALQGFYNVVKPRTGADWTLQATVTFLFPK